MLYQVLLASLFISLISFSGVFYFFLKKSLLERILKYVIGFSAGIMLAVSFLDLLPEAVASGNKNVLSFSLFGLVFFFFLEKTIIWFHHHGDDCQKKAKPTAVLITLGDSLHNFIDGVLIAASFLANPALGLAATISVAIHEIPMEVSDYSILLHSGIKRGKALFLNFASALFAVFGAILGFFFLDSFTNLIPYFLAFTAGMFIYISASDIMPDLHKNFERKDALLSLFPLLFGILVMYVTISVLEK